MTDQITPMLPQDPSETRYRLTPAGEALLKPSNVIDLAAYRSQKNPLTEVERLSRDAWITNSSQLARGDACMMAASIEAADVL